MDQQTHQWQGLYDRVLSVPQQKHWYWIFSCGTIRNLSLWPRKKLFSLWAVYLPVTPLSTFWTRPCWWMWIRTRFCPMSQFPQWKQALEGYLLGPVLWVGFFEAVWSVWFWFRRMEARIWYCVQVFLFLNCSASSSLLLKTLKATFIKVCWGVWGPFQVFNTFVIYLELTD
jgi:hypothetical protein